MSSGTAKAFLLESRLFDATVTESSFDLPNTDFFESGRLASFLTGDFFLMR